MLRSTILWGVVLGLFLVNLYLLVVFNRSSEPGSLNEADKQPLWRTLLSLTPPDQPRTSRLDGLPIDVPEDAVVSVMIDNFVSARPLHSGLHQASLIYEALVEGGITRLMAVFPYQEAARVGPIRSARDYFVSWAEEFGGIYLHEGASPIAFAQLEQSQLLSLEEELKGEQRRYSSRDDRYRKPHNLFASILQVREEAKKTSQDLSQLYADRCFSGVPPEGLEPALSIGLNFSGNPSSDSYVQFRYQAQSNVYLRFYGKQSPQAHRDQLSGLLLSPANIVVQIIPSHLIPNDEKERLQLNPIGSGPAYYFRSGTVQTGVWSKMSRDSSTLLFDSAGEKVCLLPGQTWMAILDDEELIELR
ncbi:MAG: DUF3048 domain-containing protein [bacterium]|nr:DUF3048 domain-containing protein [bacterium]